MKKIMIGVMGPGEKATAIDQQIAYELGKRIAEQGWVLLTGGRNVGVMDAASRGAKQAGGLTVGILPTESDQASEAVDIAIFTGMGNARNSINVLSSDIVVACGLGLGTASEVALALKANKPVVLLSVSCEAIDFFHYLKGQENERQFFAAQTPELAIQVIQNLLSQSMKPN